MLPCHCTLLATGLEKPNVSFDTFRRFRQTFSGTLMVNGGISVEAAQQYVADGTADLVAFAGLFIANANLPALVAAGFSTDKLNPGGHAVGGVGLHCWLGTVVCSLLVLCCVVHTCFMDQYVPASSRGLGVHGQVVTRCGALPVHTVQCTRHSVQGEYGPCIPWWRHHAGMMPGRSWFHSMDFIVTPVLYAA